MTDTIYAPSSAIGGAIAVIRISGPEAGRAGELFHRNFTKQPGMLRHGRLMDGDRLVDDCMVVFFPGPGSYTGEDMVEINCHGGIVTVRQILSLLSRLGFRPAGPGEFTRRAFENGKMDLSQAEAVMDVVTAGAERSLQAALRQLSGSVKSAVTDMEEGLMDALSGIDAAIDYPDEAEEDTVEHLPEALSRVKSLLEETILEGRRGRVLRDGIQVVILGQPNVGKSSLLNRLLGEERAIVTDIPGTTRDLLNESTVIEGVPVRFLDTAGIREGADAVERIGVARARAAAETADMILLVLDGSQPLQEEDAALLEQTADSKRILVANKMDLGYRLELAEPTVPISAKEGRGIRELQQAILEKVGAVGAGEPIITNERHLHALERALEALCQAHVSPELELAATDIREALGCLGQITGSSVDEAVIDRIFERFCVGK